MQISRHFHGALGVVVALASSLFGFVLFAPSAFALVMQPGPYASSSPGGIPTAPAAGHAVASGGMAGWEVALIAVSAALAAAAFAVYTDRVHGPHRGLGVSTA
jgi:hypothetical protein